MASDRMTVANLSARLKMLLNDHIPKSIDHDEFLDADSKTKMITLWRTLVNGQIGNIFYDMINKRITTEDALIAMEAIEQKLYKG